MSNFWISLLLAIGSSGWLFNKLQNRSGRNTSQSIIITSVCGLLIFIIVLVILAWVF